MSYRYVNRKSCAGQKYMCLVEKQSMAFATAFIKSFSFFLMLGSESLQKFLPALKMSDNENNIERPQRRPKSTNKTRKNRKHDNKSEDISNNEVTADPRIVGVLVHYSDCLNIDVHLLHPSVKVMLVDLETGRLLPKRSYEAQNPAGGHITASMTRPFVFKHSRTLVPRWEQLMSFDENFSHFASFKQKLGIFFLVQDFVSMNNANNRKEDEKGWHDVAWAFLKPFPADDIDNTEKKLRLQLFKPHPRKGAAANNKEAAEKSDVEDANCVWNWWMNLKHVKYPSSLYVTVQAVDKANNNNGNGSSSADLNKKNNIKVEADEMKNSSSAAFDVPKVPIWSRGPGQSCQIPKTEICSLDSFGRGVQCLKFSPEGRYLAAGSPGSINSTTSSVIAIYEVCDEWRKVMTFEGHSGPIYELDWFDARTLLSASGDGTARVWYLGNCGGKRKREALEHPSFVYCARFHPNTADVIVTGSYDQVIRIWKKNLDDEEEEFDDEEPAAVKKYGVVQELVAHSGFITALEFDIDGHNLYSGDKNGIIKIWEIFGKNTIEQFHKKLPESSLFFRQKKQLKISDLEGYSVESLRIHPGGRRLLVHSTSLTSSLIMLDLRQGSVMQDYKADRGVGKRVGNCVSPCGNLVFSGSNQFGTVFVWDTDTGMEKHIYEVPALETRPIHTIAYHPLDHIVAMGALGPDSPLIVYQYNKDLKV